MEAEKVETMEKDQNTLLVTELEQVKAKLADYWAGVEGRRAQDKKTFLESEEFFDLLCSRSIVLFQYGFEGGHSTIQGGGLSS